ncbi:oxysterol-binding protein related protein OSH3 Ecym_8177 [Eremothecium cymbalariae DBVPG|uniref:PH domain-containing protein n=1 Tax=Eremothecium cymbalariae (strain CBS 270.75 / DBVPG 7215 / KCTC 17166 / NRRL Y-17582) TaxID=931890 RepID=G8JX89_ERECY|nr:Hypothetical protein Ecym_8177 [Eremothecium cymbalariae DBVPG\
METIDIQNKSFVVRWLKVKRGDTIAYQIKPLKKSICLGIYKKLTDTGIPATLSNRGSPSRHVNSVSSSQNAEMPQVHIESDDRNLMVEFRNRAFSMSSSSLAKDDADEANAGVLPNPELQTRLDQSGLTKVSWIGNVQGNEIYQGTMTIEDDAEDLYYAFILDNTISKKVKKKVLFSASVVHHSQLCDNESVFSQDEVMQVDNVLSISNMNNSNLNPSSQSISGKEMFRLKQGRILQGFLLKRRRKKLQGFTKRFFKLDLKYGTLSYYLSEWNSVCRGEIVITLSTVSANKKTRLIVIDSGMEIWALKARDSLEWETWVEALESCYKANSDNQNNRKYSETETLESLAQSLLAELQIAHSKAEECKNQYALSQSQLIDKAYLKPPTPQTRSTSRSSSLSSAKGPTILAKNSSAFDEPNNNGPVRKTSKSTTSNSNAYSSVIPFPINELKGETDLYKKLSELESLLANISLKSRLIFTSPLFTSLPGCKLMDKIATTTKSSAASIFSEEFYDALDDEKAVIMLDDEEGIDGLELNMSAGSEVPNMISKDRIIDKMNSLHSETMETIQSSGGESSLGPVDMYPLPIALKVKRRDDIEKPTTTPPSLLSFLRKNVGKDLNSISMPMSSNEPITVLQLLAETFEYAGLLNKAVTTEDPVARLGLVASFATSYLSVYREKARSMRKPLNPLLGETYELVREDMGYKLISEKVSHKPQIFAFHVENKDWVCSYTISPTQKFWGKSLEFTNEGTINLVMRHTGEKFKWTQPSMILKNIIAGERYLEPTNQFEVTSSEGYKAVIAFKHSGLFSSRSEDLTITLYDNDKKLSGNLKGQWTKQLVNDATGEIVWEVNELVPEAPKKFGFTKFTANLNEITELEEGKLPPTDSRLRPDLRLYEAGDVDTAEELKLKLERMQRERRTMGQDIAPKYFRKSGTEWLSITGHKNYWEKRRYSDWSDAPRLW